MKRTGIVFSRMGMLVRVELRGPERTVDVEALRVELDRLHHLLLVAIAHDQMRAQHVLAILDERFEPRVVRDSHQELRSRHDLIESGLIDGLDRFGVKPTAQLVVCVVRLCIVRDF